ASTPRTDARLLMRSCCAWIFLSSRRARMETLLLAGTGPRIAPEPPWPVSAETSDSRLLGICPELDEFGLPSEHAHHTAGIVPPGDAFVGRARDVVVVLG